MKAFILLWYLSGIFGQPSDGTPMHGWTLKHSAKCNDGFGVIMSLNLPAPIISDTILVYYFLLKIQP